MATTEETIVQIGANGQNWVLDIELENKQVDAIAESDLWRKHCIYQVPAAIKDLNPQAYKPQVVSFGPYYHGEESLQPMEDHKRRALHHFLRRTGRRLSCFVEAMDAVLPDLIGAYERLDGEWTANNGEEFRKVMIVDGCFMLELIRFFAHKPCNYSDNDPIFSRHGMMYTAPYIRRDMLRVENQIPLLALKTLVSVEPAIIEGEVDREEEVGKLVHAFCGEGPHTGIDDLNQSLHPLDVARKSLLRKPPGFSRMQQKAKNIASDIVVRSAVELDEAGVFFRKSNTKSLRDVSFRHGILRLPFMVIDDSTESLLLNLMAFERLHHHADTGSEVTSYVFFLDNIIDTAQDVGLLHAKGIIQNALGSDKAVAKLFNTLCKDVTLDPNSHLEAIRCNVNTYCSKPWNKWRANLIHTYFRSPWALLSLLAAIFLLVLTVLSTIYGALQYYQG